MTPEIENEIRAHALEAYPLECCGLVINTGSVLVYKRCRNLAESPKGQFVMCAEDRADAEDMGEIVRLVHSHPQVSARPSEADLVQCEASGLEWTIVHVSRSPDDGTVSTGEMYSFKPSGYVAPLRGRSFHYGVLDCYTLIKDYYKRELGIELPHYEYEHLWWEKGQDLYMERFRSAGFEPIVGQMRQNDVIIMQVRAKKANHAGIYMGDGLILHHLMDRLSTLDVYDGYWQRATRVVVRRPE
jgi:proteasome lid subunit RPN8/RPN11